MGDTLIKVGDAVGDCGAGGRWPGGAVWVCLRQWWLVIVSYIFMIPSLVTCATTHGSRDEGFERRGDFVGESVFYWFKVNLILLVRV